MKNNSKIFTIIAIAVMAIVLVALGIGYILKATEEVKNPIVTMEVENYGTIKLELYPDMAPNTVAHFIKLINNGFYDGLTFHRVMPDFMIQGGDKEGTGAGKTTLKALNPDISDEEDKEYCIPGEFIANGYADNKLKHERGVLSMARADYSSYGSGLTSYSYNSGSSQFFIMTKDTASLDGYYAAFGRVIEGMDVVDKIANAEVVYRSSELKDGEEAPKNEDGTTIASDRPKDPPKITKMTVETYGADYGDPVTTEPFDYYAWFEQTYGYDPRSVFTLN